MVLPEKEILETSEHDKKLKNVRQNMTQKDNCKWSEYSEVPEKSEDHPSETPMVVSTSEDSNKTRVVTDSGKADDAVISKVDTVVENSDNNDVVQECEEIIGPSDIIKVEEESNSTNVAFWAA